jgi:N4-gp56 family major capsid protein
MAYTDTGGSSLGTSLVQTAYDRYVKFALRSTPMFRDFATVKPVAQAMPGSSVVFQLYNDMAAATSALTETSDVTPVAIGNTSTVTVTLTEYGNAALVTRKLQLFSLADVDPAIANMIAYNMADSTDVLVQTVLRGGSQIIRENGGSLVVGGATASVASTDVAKMRDFTTAVTKLRAASVVPVFGRGLYAAVVHPEVSHDLRAQTGQGGWLTPQEYGASQERLDKGEIGAFGGAAFVENPRCYNATDGASSAKVHRSYVLGQECLAEAVAEEFHTVIGPVVDTLMRHRPIGWYGVAGWNRYRATALWQIQTSSTI